MRDRILETADRLFYGQGIRAIGVDTVAAEIGISKRTLYNHFPSKEALIEAYLGRRFTSPRPSDVPPVEQILSHFDRLERLIAGGHFRGCPFVNAVTELGESSPPVTEIAIAFKEQQRTWFRDLLASAGAPDPDNLATQLAILVDGALVTAQVRGDPSMTRAAKDAAVVLLAAAGIATANLAEGVDRPLSSGEEAGPRQSNQEP